MNCNLRYFPSSKARNAFILFILAVLLVFPWKERPFYSRGEPREALVAQAMLATSNWILPSVYSNDKLDIAAKPPFTHWLMSSVSFFIGELNETAARAPSALAYIIFLIAFYLFLHSRLGQEKAFLSCLVLMLSLEWYRAALTARVDMTLAALFAGGLVSLFTWVEKDLKNLPFIPIVLFAAATLTKGPVSIALSALIFGIYLLLSRYSVWQAMHAVALVIVPAFLLSFIWYFLAYDMGGEVFLDKFFYENTDRFFSINADKPHPHSVFYLYATLLFGLLPWVFVLIPLLRLNVRKFWAGLRGYYDGLTPFLRYCVLCVVLIIVFFSIPSSKRSVYLLPAYPFIAALIAAVLVDCKERVSKLMPCYVWIMSLLAYVVYISLGLIYFRIINLEVLFSHSGRLAVGQYVHNTLALVLYEVSKVELLVVIAPLVLLTLLVYLIQKKADTKIIFKYSVGALFSIYLAISICLLPKIALSLSPKAFAAEVSAILKKHQKSYTYNNSQYAMSFYLKQKLDRVDEHLPDDALVFIYERKLEQLRKQLKSGQHLKVLKKSQRAIRKPKDKLLLVQIGER